MFCNREGLTF